MIKCTCSEMPSHTIDVQSTADVASGRVQIGLY